MNQNKLKDITLSLLNTLDEAGKLAQELRKKGLSEKIKNDNTPVTNGDIEINKILTKKISELKPDINIVSEETTENKEKKMENFWLIDPIDGTYDYINNKEEYTLNAALIIDKKPALGIINAPDKKRLFYSYGPSNSYELNNGKEIKLNKKKKENKNLITAVSYSNKLKPEILQIHKKYNVDKYQKMKSSYKLCVIAASEFDLYVAEPRACEWDIAAGHAIAVHAGGEIKDFNGNEIIYGKDDFKNTSIILKNKNIS